MSESIADTAEIFKALGDSSRLKILKLIAAHGNNLCVGIIASKLVISQPAVSQHLKVLKNTKLVEANRAGYHIHYSVNVNALDGFGIKTKEFLSSIGAEFDTAGICELKEDAESCEKLQ